MNNVLEDHDAGGSGGGPRTIRVQVTEDLASMRLDQALGSNADIGLSRSRVKRLIQSGAVTLGGQIVDDPGRRLSVGDPIVLEIPELEPALPRPQAIPLDIRYEDDALIVVDKPAGLVVHPGAGVLDGTLVNALLHHRGATLSGIGGVRRPGIVHRLDKATSGLLVVAKTDQAHQALSAQFADHGRTGPLDRRYLALVWDTPSPARGRIEGNIGRSSSNRLLMAVVKSGGRPAVTHYTVKQRFGPDGVVSLVECRLETGRTHQIRVHLTHIGHPVVGDPDYGRGFRTKASALPEPARRLATGLARQALHATVLAFEHPRTGREMRFESPLPADIADLRRALEQT